MWKRLREFLSSCGGRRRVWGMRYFLLMIAVVALVGCGTTSWISDPSNPNNVKIEKAIRKGLRKPEGELTKAQIDQLQKALPKCEIYSNPTK